MQVQLSLPLLLSVGIGGGVGAISRLLISQWSLQRLGDGFSWGTLLANIAGAFLAGLIFALIDQKILLNEFWRPLLLIGFLGGLTTFSTFSLELLIYLQREEWVLAGSYLLLSILLCLCLAWLGMYSGTYFCKSILG